MPWAHAVRSPYVGPSIFGSLQPGYLTPSGCSLKEEMRGAVARLTRMRVDSLLEKEAVRK